jgi:hypothetical protein
MTVQTSQRHDASLHDLVGQVTQQLGTLVRDEIRLAQLEIGAKAKRAGMGAGMFGAVAALALVGLGCLAAAAIAALSGPLATWLAAVIVGGGLFVVAGFGALIAAVLLRAAAPPAPTEAIQGVKRDVETIRYARTFGGRA